MSAFDLLTENDKDLIKQYIDWYGGDFSSPIAPLERVLREWNERKSENLETLFGGESLILSRPYTYTMSKEGLYREYDRLYSSNSGPLQTFRKFIIGIPLSNPEMEQYREFLESLTTRDTLIESAYVGPSFIMKFGDGELWKIPRGIKLMKIFHKLCEKFSPIMLLPRDLGYMVAPSYYDEFREWHSRLFNQAYMDGELCISIHPLDFMTMSDNDNGWDSCMTWARSSPGDYRAGTLECLNSPYIIIAYLHNPKHKMKLGGSWEWNSKRWRELFIVHEGVISEIKGYPYQDENLTNAVLMWIKELASKNLQWEYDDKETNIKDVIDVDNENELLIDFEPTYFMYNDFGTLEKHRARLNMEKLFQRAEEIHQRGYYTRYGSWEWNCSVYKDRNNEKWQYTLSVPYGGTATCMCCGGWLDDEEERSSFVVCDDCYPSTHCSCCGDRLEPGEIYWVDDCPLCEGCYDNNTAEDSLTGESHMADGCQFTNVYWKIGEDEYGRPVYYDDYISVYELEDSDAYFDIFKNEPRREKRDWFYYDYVTLDDVIDMDKFKRVFEIYCDIQSIVDEYLPNKETKTDVS